MTTSANWSSSTSPSASSTLYFGPLKGGQTVANNSFVSASFSGIEFLGNGAALNSAAYLLTGNSLTITGPILNNSTNPQVIDLPITLDTGGGTIGSIASSLTINGVLSGTSSAVTVTKVGAGTVVLSATNCYTEPTAIQAGALQAADGVGLPSASNLTFNGNLAGYGCGAVLQTSGTFNRPLGSVAGQVQWTGDGGFAAIGGPLTVSIPNGGSPLAWGSTPYFVPAGNVLTFGSAAANAQVNFTDDIDLTGGTRQIDVAAGAGGDSVLISGNLMDSSAGSTGALTKTGNGTLILTGTNVYAGPTTIAGGVLQALDGQSLPSASNLVFSGSIARTGVGAVLQSSGTFTRAVGNGPGLVEWTGDGGFAANGGSLTVSTSPGGGAVLGQQRFQ